MAIAAKMSLTAAAKKSAPRKTVAIKTVAKQAPAKRTAPKKTVAKKSVSKVSATKKAAPKKAAPKKAAPKKAAKPRTRKFDLVIDRAKGAKFGKEGLRPQFEYRHFGVEEATGRRYAAHVIRAAGDKTPIRHHVHPDCEFLLVYVIKGWVKFWYDGPGEQKLSAGDVHLLPAGIKHAVTAWSKDLEMLEVTHPADYQSIELTDAQIARL